MNTYYVYIIFHKKNETLKTYITTDLIRSIEKKKNEDSALIYFERVKDAAEAAKRKMQIDNWNSSQKAVLIDKLNPGWKDLYNDVFPME